MLKLTGIFIYPIKGLSGISLEKSKVEKEGLEWDRRWVLVDENGKFISQRGFSEMALLQPEFEDAYLKISHKTKEIEPLRIPTGIMDDAEKIMVTVWKDTVEAVLVGEEYDQWFSEVLQTKCRLVKMIETTNRVVDQDFGKAGDIVSFADAYPILIVGEASLADLNSKLEESIPMDRFRPNLVFTGGKAFEEDTWKLFQIGKNTVFRGAKPCARCQVPTINQNTGIMGKEPMRTMKTFRKKGSKILFGMCVCWDKEFSKGANIELEIGDKIVVRDW